MRLAFEAIGTYFIKTVNGLLLRVHKIDACSESRECFSNNLGSHAYAGANLGRLQPPAIRRDVALHTTLACT